MQLIGTRSSRSTVCPMRGSSLYDLDLTIARDRNLRHNELFDCNDAGTGLKRVLEADSIFSQKLIVCKLNREEKITLAGNRLKRTGPPRFSTADPVYQTIESNKAAREVLRHVFGIPLEASEGLDLTKSLLADPGMWSHA